MPNQETFVGWTLKDEPDVIARRKLPSATVPCRVTSEKVVVEQNGAMVVLPSGTPGLPELSDGALYNVQRVSAAQVFRSYRYRNAAAAREPVEPVSVSMFTQTLTAKKHDPFSWYVGRASRHRKSRGTRYRAVGAGEVFGVNVLITPHTLHVGQAV